MNRICQSCGLSLEQEELFGTNADGSKNDTYCKFCFQNGKFGKNETLEEMIESCVPFLLNDFPTEGDARKYLWSVIPNLKRWKK